MDSSDCDELPEGTLARIQSQELLDRSLDGDAIQIGDADRKLRTVKRAPHGRNSQINKMEDCLSYDPHRVQVDNYNLTDDETNDDDIDDDVDQDDDESQGHGKFEPTVKDLALSSTNVSCIQITIVNGVRIRSTILQFSLSSHHNIDFIEKCRRINDFNYDHLNN